MRIRILNVDGCPHSEQAVNLVREIVAREEVQTVVEAIEVKSESDAIRLRSFGSPTLQVDGVDVEPAARGRSDFAIACRLYGGAGVPPSGMVAAAIRVASGRMQVRSGAARE